MAWYTIRLSTPAGKNPVVSGDKRLTILNLIRLLTSVRSGIRGATTLQTEHTGVQASGTLTLSTASGTVGGTINGVSVTVSASGGDTTTAAAIAAAINASANALVSNHVTASSSGAVVTVTSKFPNHAGNAVTLAASGTGVTASGARLTGGSATSNSFTF